MRYTSLRCNQRFMPGVNILLVSPPKDKHLKMQNEDQDNSFGWLCGLAAAVFAPAVLLAIYFSAIIFASPEPNSSAMLFWIPIVAVPVSFLHVLFLAVPGLILLSKRHRLRADTVCVLGFLAGCLPIGVWTWPLKSSLHGASYSQWDGEKMVSSMIDGVPTLTGSIDYGEGVLMMFARSCLRMGLLDSVETVSLIRSVRN